MGIMVKQNNDDSLSSSIKEYNLRLNQVKISKNNNSLRLQWTIKGLGQQSLTLGKANAENLNRVFYVALTIQNDMLSGQYDISKDKYRLLHNPSYAIAKTAENVIPLIDKTPKIPTILELWQWYKGVMGNSVAESTIKYTWDLVDNRLALLPDSCLQLHNADQLVEYFRSDNCNKGKGYADSTIFVMLQGCISPAVNLAIEMNKLPDNFKNPYTIWVDESKGLLQLPDKKPILAYDSEQIKIVLNAFKNNDYFTAKRSDAVPDSYYTDFVAFRFYTGLRPSETVALQWSDIVWENDQPKQIIIRKRKVHSCKVDKGTKISRKTGTIARTIPCNNQLKELINSLPSKDYDEKKNPHNLLFPAPRGGYLNQHDFAIDTWNRVIQGLVDNGLLPYSIVFYAERHCTATHLARAGVDVQTASGILGNSPETYYKHYVAPKDNDDIIPEM